MSAIRRSAPLLVGAALAAATVVAVATPAQAANGRIGVREEVCAQTLSLRRTPNGAWDGYLEKGETFLVQIKSGSYVYGFAYGQLNREGWVQDGWFCPL